MSINNLFLALAVVLVPVCCFANGTEFNIVPKPNKIEIGNGKFTIDKNTVIYYDNAFNGEYLKKYIDKATGYSTASNDA